MWKLCKIMWKRLHRQESFVWIHPEVMCGGEKGFPLVGSWLPEVSISVVRPPCRLWGLQRSALLVKQWMLVWLKMRIPCEQLSSNTHFTILVSWNDPFTFIPCTITFCRVISLINFYSKLIFSLQETVVNLADADSLMALKGYKNSEAKARRLCLDSVQALTPPYFPFGRCSEFVYTEEL